MGVFAKWPAEILGFSIVDRSDQAVDGRDKGLHRSGVGFGQRMGAMDPVIHHHECAAPGGIRVGGDGHGIVKVERPVGADGGGGAHGPGQNHRLFAFNGQVEKISRLFHGVGAVGDDHAVDLIGAQQGVDPVGQVDHDGKGHVLGTHIGDLLAIDTGDIG
jgi:hypothetical protein